MTFYKFTYILHLTFYKKQYVYSLTFSELTIFVSNNRL